jgi:hypothetical protein
MDIRDAITKRPLGDEEKRRLHIEAMWLAFLRAPAKATAPGEPVDLGEIGEERSSRGVDRPTPYSPGRVR